MEVYPVIETKPGDDSLVSGDRADFIGLDLERSRNGTEKSYSCRRTSQDAKDGKLSVNGGKPEKRSSGNSSMTTESEKPDVSMKTTRPEEPLGNRTEDIDTESVTDFERMEKEVAEDEIRSKRGSMKKKENEELSRNLNLDSPRSNPTSPEPRNTKPKSGKEKLQKPFEDPIIAGPLDVALSFTSEWKRRFITIVGEGLYIWTSHR